MAEFCKFDFNAEAMYMEVCYSGHMFTVGDGHT